MNDRIDEFDVAFAKILAVWELFKANHDVTSAKVNCCELSNALFEALELADRMVEENSVVGHA